jgi:uncharacterized repeat protein (TIGR04076 family)
MFCKCKVTVMKRGCAMDLVRSFVKVPEKFSICNQVEDNQEFIVPNPYEMPKGICAYAWADIRPQILSLASGGTFPFLKDENSTIATCSDPFRPVIFKIEKLDD